MGKRGGYRISYCIRILSTCHSALSDMHVPVEPRQYAAACHVCRLAVGVVHLWSATSILFWNFWLGRRGSMDGACDVAKHLSGAATLRFDKIRPPVRCA